MVNTGKASEEKCLRSLAFAKTTYPKLWYRRIPDTYDLRRKNHDQRTIAPPALADFLALHNGKAMAIEVKSSRNPSSYDVNWVKDTQLEALLDFEEAGGVSYILLHAKALQRASFIGIKAWCGPISELCSGHYLHWCNIPREYELAYISPSEASAHGCGKEGVWDLTPYIAKL